MATAVIKRRQQEIIDAVKQQQIHHAKKKKSFVDPDIRMGRVQYLCSMYIQLYLHNQFTSLAHTRTREHAYLLCHQRSHLT